MRPTVFQPFTALTKPRPGDTKYSQCEVGHEKHEKIKVVRQLKGQPIIPDIPPSPDHLATELTMCVYDWNLYGGDEFNAYQEYCPGQDVISYSIVRAGIWEGYETLLVLDVVSEADKGVVIDFGSHVGYYSMIAAQWGREVAAIDALPENVQMVKRNARLNATDGVHAFHGWLDKESPVLSTVDELVHFVKIDVEGAEQYAVAMCADLIAQRKIKYLLIEVSPVFNETYPNLCWDIAQAGYDVYQVPAKGWKFSAEFSKQPLQTLKEHCKLSQETLREYVSHLRQENFLFIRRD